MRRPLFLILLLPIAASAAIPWAVSSPKVVAPDDAAVHAVRFVPNLGQWHGDVRYASIGDTAGWLHDDGFTLRFERWSQPADTGPATATTAPEQSGCVVRTRFVDAAKPTFVPGRDLPGHENFFLGNDPTRWRTDVPSYATITMHGALPGIDVVFRPLPAGRPGPFEYDLVLAPGADLTRFVAVCDGVDTLHLDREGRLCARLTTPTGGADLVQEAPIAWQDTPAGRVPLRVEFRLLGTRRYGFAARNLDPTWPATVDPGVVWGTYLGGGASDSVNTMRWKSGTGIWVAGWAGSTDFPTTVGAYRTTGGSDAFVARLQENGSSLVYSTYLGGAAGEEVRGLAIGPGDTATVVGFTASNDFPVTPGAVQPTYQGSSQIAGIGDGFLVRLAPNGAELLGATYLGGTSDDVAEGVAVAANGDAVVTGFTFSGDFPTTPGVWQPNFNSIPFLDSDGFVARVSANAQALQYSTFVGGFASDQLIAVDIEATTGDVLVAGWTQSSNFPATFNAYGTTNSGDVEVMIARLNANASAPVFATYLGGVSGENANDAHFAADGSVWVGGRTNSTNYPATLNAPQRVNAGTFDGFLSHLSANGQNLLFSTLIGGPGVDSVRAFDLGLSGIAIVGEAGPGFPVTQSPIQAQFAGGNLDGFISYLTAGGTVLSYSSYLGGTNQDMLRSVRLDPSGIAVVGGWSFSTDFPVAPAGFQATLHGVQDGVVVQFDLLSQLGAGFAVASAPAVGPIVVAAGPQTLLSATVENVTDRDITIEAVRLLLAGAGSAPLQSGSLRVWLDVTGAAAPVLVAGPVAVPLDDDETEMLLSGAVLPAHTVGALHFDCDLVAGPAGRTVELAAAIVDRDAWRLRASGVGTGPEVRVLGSGRAEGTVLVEGALPGDADGDAQPTVFDLRLLLSRLGHGAPAIDCDGDLVITANDVALLRAAVLGRPALVQAPSVVTVGRWFTLRGVFGTGQVDATLGGRAVTPGCVTAREITLRVDPGQAKGTQDLSVLLAGQRVFLGPVLVQ